MAKQYEISYFYRHDLPISTYGTPGQYSKHSTRFTWLKYDSTMSHDIQYMCSDEENFTNRRVYCKISIVGFVSLLVNSPFNSFRNLSVIPGEFSCMVQVLDQSSILKKNHRKEKENKQYNTIGRRMGMVTLIICQFKMACLFSAFNWHDWLIPCLYSRKWRKMKSQACNFYSTSWW